MLLFPTSDEGVNYENDYFENMSRKFILYVPEEPLMKIGQMIAYRIILPKLPT